jgi:hypothetical protein
MDYTGLVVRDSALGIMCVERFLHTRQPGIVPNDYAVGFEELDRSHPWKLTRNPLFDGPMRWRDVLELEDESAARPITRAFFLLYGPFRFKSHRAAFLLFNAPSSAGPGDSDSA